MLLVGSWRWISIMEDGRLFEKEGMKRNGIEMFECSRE